MSEITTGQGGRLAYEESGSGPVLLFIHGWAMSGRVWRYQREEFSTDHRVITLDLRGHGSSAIPDAGPSIDDFAGDIESRDAAFDVNERRGDLLLDGDARVAHGLGLGFGDGVGDRVARLPE